MKPTNYDIESLKTVNYRRSVYDTKTAMGLLNINKLSLKNNVLDTSCTCRDYYDKRLCLHSIALLLYQNKITIPQDLFIPSNSHNYYF